jgi:hypothetical protein
MANKRVYEMFQRRNPATPTRIPRPSTPTTNNPPESTTPTTRNSGKRDRDYRRLHNHGLDDPSPSPIKKPLKLPRKSTNPSQPSS